MFKHPFKEPFKNPFKEVSSGFVDINGGAFLFNGAGVADDIVNCGSGSSIDDIFDSGGSLVWNMLCQSDGEGSAGIILGKTQWTLATFGESGGNTRIRIIYIFDGDNAQWRSNYVFDLTKYYQIILTYNNSATTNDPIIYYRSLTDSETSWTTLTVGSGISETTTPTGTRVSDAGNSLYIGNESTTARTFDGKFFDCRVLATGATAGDRTALLTYLDTITAPAAWWKCQETSGTSVEDSSANSNTGTISGSSGANFFSTQDYY